MSTPTSPDDNKALVRQWFAEIDKGEHADVDRFLAPDYIDHNPPSMPVTTSAREAVKEYSAGFRAALRDFRHVVEDQIAEGDKVVSRITAYGTHCGELMGIPATGRQVTMTGIAIHRVTDGKLVEHWSQNDLLGLLQRLGVVPDFSANSAPPPREAGGSEAAPRTLAGR
ncbi:MAG: ester cyclase [Chloroflexi bacterium]|nr:ester cyclase [Chloroflexota bacterium]MBV9598559.1 ester cyclase [Chloroflexota bacterium]